MAGNHNQDPQPTTVILSAVLLGRIQVAVTRANKGTLQTFAARLVRESLISALRNEGHEFTEERFFTWFAGLATLSDASGAVLRPPRALCQAILTEFRHSPWIEMAEVADDLLKAFLAPSDFLRGNDHAEAHAIIAEARSLVAALAPVDDALPFRPTNMLYAAAARTARFAREDRTTDLVGCVAVEREHIANARWALDILAGLYLAPRYGLPVALPIPGLVVLPPHQSDMMDPFSPEPQTGEDAVFSALYDGFSRLDRWFGEAELADDYIRTQLQECRSSGRALQLAGYVAGFGPMRGRQIEHLLNVSRSGVSVITATLEASLVLVSQKSRNATRMYNYGSAAPAPVTGGADTAPFASSAAAINDFEEAMRAVDDLLQRSFASDSGGQKASSRSHGADPT